MDEDTMEALLEVSPKWLQSDEAARLQLLDKNYRQGLLAGVIITLAGILVGVFVTMLIVNDVSVDPMIKVARMVG